MVSFIIFHVTILLIATRSVWSSEGSNYASHGDRELQLGTGNCGSATYNRDTEGCCVVQTTGPTVVNSATQGCCLLSTGFQQVMTIGPTATQGCCYTGPQQQTVINLSTNGCCNTLNGGEYQEVVTIATTGCCGPDPGLQETVDYGNGEICCDGNVVQGPTCPPGMMRSENYAASRFVAYEQLPSETEFEQAESNWAPLMTDSTAYIVGTCVAPFLVLLGTALLW